MGIISWMVLGFIAGISARYVMPGRDAGGLVATILLGIAGGVAGGLLGTTFGFGTISGFDFRSLLIAVVGAIAVLFMFRLYSARSTV